MNKTLIKWLIEVVSLMFHFNQEKAVRERFIRERFIEKKRKKNRQMSVLGR